MLLHRYFRPTRWLGAVAAIVLVLGACAGWLFFHPEGWTGGSTPGLWFGAGGLGCFFWTFIMLPLQRRRHALAQVGAARNFWLQGHLWVALLGVALILAHTGMCQGFSRLGGRLEAVLMVVLALTVLTGFAGLALQHWLPRRLTRLAVHEIPVGQMPHLCQVLRQQADVLVEQMGKALESPTAARLAQLYEQHLRPVFSEGSAWRRRDWASCRLENGPLAAALPRPMPAAVVKDWQQLGEICAVRLELFKQERLHWWLHSWLLVHVPMAVALLFLAVVHAIVSLCL
jgi:hypothetical protein